MLKAIMALKYTKNIYKLCNKRTLCTSAEIPTDEISGNERETSEERNYKFITYETLDRICLIGLNRPEERNAVNHEMATELRQAFEDYLWTHSADVAVLYGHGGNFCAGYDLAELSQVEGNPVDYLTKDHGPMGPTRMHLSKPVIAAVSGYAVAGGLELALLCDMRIAEENAVFGVFCRRFGVPLIDGGTVRLPQVIGFGRAMDMILTGRPVKVKEAHDWGLVNRVTERGCALGEATLIANGLLKYPQQCLLADRRSAYFSVYSDGPMWGKLMHEFRSGKKALSTECVEGAKKFVSGDGKHGKFLPTKNVDSD